MRARAYINLKFTAIWCYTIGKLAKGNADLGALMVKGLMRVPYPPTNMSAFILLCLVIKNLIYKISKYLDLLIISTLYPYYLKS